MTNIQTMAINGKQVRLMIGALAIILFGFANAQQALASDGPSSSKEQRNNINFTRTEENTCIGESVVVKGREEFRDRVETKPDGRIKIRSHSHAVGDGVGSFGGRYNFLEHVQSETESSETEFELRFDQRKHLIRRMNDLPKEDLFLRTKTRLFVKDGVTRREQNEARVECR